MTGGEDGPVCLGGSWLRLRLLLVGRGGGFRFLPSPTRAGAEGAAMKVVLRVAGGGVDIVTVNVVAVVATADATTATTMEMMKVTVWRFLLMESGAQQRPSNSRRRAKGPQ